jgi:hypothetical protein
VNSPLQPTRRPSLWPLLRDYLWAVLKHWYAVGAGLVLGVVDLVERSRATWYLFPEWLVVTTAVAILASAQFLAYRDLHHAHLKELDALEDEKERQSEKHTAEEATLHREIETLKVRPFDKALAELVRDKLRGLDPIALDVLRFLVQHGPTDRDSMDRQLSCAQPAVNGAVANLGQRLLILHEERPNIGISRTVTLWRVNETFDQVLRDLLF